MKGYYEVHQDIMSKKQGQYAISTKLGYEIGGF
jgi:hypothetical protein